MNASASAPAALTQQGISFQLLVDAVTDYAICMLDTEGRIIGWNAGAEHITGWAGDEILGRHFSTFHMPEGPVGGKAAQALETARDRGATRSRASACVRTGRVSSPISP